MGHSLAEAAVRGIAKPTTGISNEARELLDAGDIDGLLRFHRATFGGHSMVEGDGNDDDGDDGDDDDSDDEDDDDDDDDDEDDKDDKQSKSAAQKRIEELSAESRKHRKKASERGRRIRELEAELEKSKKGKQGDKDGDEPDEDVKQVLDDFPKVLEDNEQLRIENAFLRHGKFKWRNPKAALKLADLSDVEITDDGEVEGLDDALEALAKSDPYLLADKDGKQDDDDDEDDSDSKPKRKRTGQPTGKSKKGNPNRDKLLAKYPALRR